VHCNSQVNNIEPLINAKRQTKIPAVSLDGLSERFDMSLTARMSEGIKHPLRMHDKHCTPRRGLLMTCDKPVEKSVLLYTGR